jgi:hypothetical protein
MKFILPSALSSVILLVADTAKFNGVYATSSNNIFGDNNNNSSSTDVMSRVFVRYKPGHKTEVAESLGINVKPVGYLSIVDDAVSNDVYYDLRSSKALSSAFLSPN